MVRLHIQRGLLSFSSINDTSFDMYWQNALWNRWRQANHRPENSQMTSRVTRLWCHANVMTSTNQCNSSLWQQMALDCCHLPLSAEMPINSTSDPSLSIIWKQCTQRTLAFNELLPLQTIVSGYKLFNLSVDQVQEYFNTVQKLKMKRVCVNSQEHVRNVWYLTTVWTRVLDPWSRFIYEFCISNYSELQ